LKRDRVHAFAIAFGLSRTLAAPLEGERPSRDSDTDAPAAPSGNEHARRRHSTVAIAAVGVAMAAYAGYGSGALLRIGAFDHPVRLVAGCLALAALWVAGQKKPLAVTCVLLAILPLFGNHPGGRYMEFVNLPVAASAAGLIAAARRGQRPAPDGPIWRLAFLYLLTAIVAMIPTLPRLIVRAAQINDPMLFVAEALTAPEDNAMYSISSLVLVTLAVVWGFALSWGAGTAHRFTENAYRVLTLTLFGVVAIGISDYAGLTALGPAYLRAIDARFVHLVGLQSIFWQPGWFAWYFVIVFAIALGLWTIEMPRRRLWLGSGILLCYLLFFLNPQRGGLIAVHVVLSLFAWYSIRRTAEPRRSYQRLVAVGLPVLVLVAGLLSVPASRAAVARGNLLSIERSINNTLEFLRPHDDANRNASERLRLWRAAMVMWRDAPAFGIGEGSFAWRFHEYIPAGSALDTPSYWDAHNTWLQLLATRGIAGAAVFTLLVCAVARALWVRWHHPVTGPGVTGPILALAGFVTYSVVSALFYLQAIQLLFWFLVAIAAAPASTPTRTSGWFKWTVAVGCLVSVVVQLVVVQPLWAEARVTLARQPRGFHPIELGPEGPQMWSSASGVLCLKPDASRVRLRFAVVDPRAATLPRTVTLRANGRDLDRFDIATSQDITTRDLEFADADDRPRPIVPFGECSAESRRLTVSVNRTWSPVDTGFSADARRLGVLVFEPTYLPSSPW
jgi:O-antigen ligase